VVNYAKVADFLRAAISLDPQFAEAYESLALSYWVQAGVNVKSGEGQRLTFEAAQQALALDPSLVLARALKRSADLENYSWLAEIQAFEQVMREQPGNAFVLDMLAFDLMEAGYLQEAAEYAERLFELDPLSEAARGRYGDALISLGSNEKAMSYGYPYARGILYFFAGQYEKAAGEYERMDYFSERGGSVDSGWVAEAFEKGRDPVNGSEYLDRLVAERIDVLPDVQRYYAWMTVVTWYAVFGHLDRYFEIIQSLDLTSSTWTDADWLVYMGTVLRRELPFTAHPKYLEVIESIGLDNLWDQRGAPDFCRKEGGDWTCW